MTRLVVFGTGDLTNRHLLPAVAEAMESGAVAADVRVVVVGRRELAPRSLLEQVAGDRLDSLEYRIADAVDAEAVREVLSDGEDPVVAYLALPPTVFPDAVDALAAAGLPKGSRIVVEKPFGDDAESAAALNRKLLAVVPEAQVFRVDHFVSTRVAHDILTLRFANSVFEPLWNHRWVESVEIVWDEELTLEGRAGYYDGAGAARDMIQNHLLQLLCLVAMEPPSALTAPAVGARRVEVLHATRAWDASSAHHSIRGRYTAGRIGDRDVPSYLDEEGVDPDAATETFAQITFAIDAPRWRDVPFVLRSGKALGRDRHEVAVRFRPAPPVEFCADAVEPNVLRFEVEPSRVALDAVLTRGQGIFATAAVRLSSPDVEPESSAYASVLAGVLGGDDVLSVGADEAEQAWRVIQPVLDAARDEVPLLDYAAGSSGPDTR